MAVDGIQQRLALNPFFIALSLFRRHRWDDCVAKCTELLARNPTDQAVWFLKLRALTKKQWMDDLEMEDEGAADLLMDENKVASKPRPGTSLMRPLTKGDGGPTQIVRPVSSSGRPMSGFARPGTSNRPTTSAQGRSLLTTALAGNKAGASRPLTSAGRLLRLGTASMREVGDDFMNVERLDLDRYAQKNVLAKGLCDFLLYVMHNPRLAMVLATEASKLNPNDWWWKARCGKALYQLGIVRDAEKYFRGALELEETVSTHLELCKVFIKLDQPNSALDQFGRAGEKFPGDTQILLGLARTYDLLNSVSKGVQFYKRVLHFDAFNAEAISCLASNHFYSDQPEIAMRFYRRLLQNGIQSAELWNNLALCCYYSGQYDLTLSCFERALNMADDSTMADVWYNIGQMAIGVGDLGLAYQAFKISISVDPNHAESFNNLGVLELRKGNIDQSQAHFRTAMNLGPHLFEPIFNGGLLAFKLGEFQESFELANKSLGVFPDHVESQELRKQLKSHFQTL